MTDSSDKKNSIKGDFPIEKKSSIKEKDKAGKKNNLTDLQRLRKKLESKYADLLNNPYSGYKGKKYSRKSVNLNNELMFKNQAVFINNGNEIRKTSSIKNKHRKRDLIIEEDKDESTPKFKNKKDKRKK